MTIYNLPQNIDVSDLLVEISIDAKSIGLSVYYDTNSITPPIEIEISPDPTPEQEAGLLKIIAKYQDEANAVAEFPNLPNWVRDWTPQQAGDYLTNLVFNGVDIPAMEAQVDNLPNTIAGMKQGLKTVGEAIIELRDAMAIEAMLILLMRDLVIKYKEAN